ncbi:glutathione S-transferase [Sphingobium sp. Sx8-8]|uniref:glutathione S-transferase family protein n=1 Tax=Sphingobium sp. Sx8-8 TaxID=2933617 RepID=UPI001F56E47D|nr:glutathione S-transferase [Sphingobium sp. Sx8-8]
MTLVLHHLNNSRSHRILWLLEELGVDYDLRIHRRDPVTFFAPPELEAAHPLGKAPVIEDGDIILAESGAIVQYLCETQGKGRFLPAEGTPGGARHLELMHLAEGSVMPPIMLRFTLGALGEAAAPAAARFATQVEQTLDYLEAQIGPAGFFVGESLTGVDVMMSYPAEIAVRMGLAANRPRLAAFVEGIHARPAWARAVARGGGFSVVPGEEV